MSCFSYFFLFHSFTDKIVDDLGTAYGMGCLGGAVWHFGSGFRHNPKGARFRGALERASIRAPQTGGSFAAWGGMFSVFDCSLIALRQKEDPINAITAGALTGGLLAIRGIRHTHTHKQTQTRIYYHHSSKMTSITPVHFTIITSRSSTCYFFVFLCRSFFDYVLDDIAPINPFFDLFLFVFSFCSWLGCCR
jgi:hypothetical protein